MQFKSVLVFAAAASVMAAPATTPGAAPVIGVLSGEADTSAVKVRQVELDVRAAGAAPVIGVLSGEADTSAVKARQVETLVTAAITDLAKNAISSLITKGINTAIDLVKAISNWTDARESFTKATVKALWDANPDNVQYPAAICYNMGYKIEKPEGQVGLVSAELKSSKLHTDYDCFYMTGNNAFLAEGDGGYINIAIYSDSNRCTYDKKAVSLRCT